MDAPAARVGGAEPPPDASPASPSAASPSSLGQLLLDLTAQVQDERKRREDAEKRNHALMLELDQLQREALDLRTAASVAGGGGGRRSIGSTRDGRRRHSTTDIATLSDAARRLGEHEPVAAGGSGRAASPPPSPPSSASSPSSSRSPLAPAPAPTATFLCQELQSARAAKDRAMVESHQRALQVLELSACVSMQHDELAALRSASAQAQAALAESERARGDAEREKALVQRELELARDDGARLAREVGARGEHVAALMEKWTEAQARSEHLERQRDEAAGELADARARGDELARQHAQLADERDCLQHQVHHLKGAVAAKSAESRAFQAFGAHAREHVQAQSAALQRQLVLRRGVHARARAALAELRTLRAQVARELRAPMLALQADCRRFLAGLGAPVMALVADADRYARVAHLEHAPLREALAESEQARRHLHDQLWQARRDAAIVAQVAQQPADRLAAPSSPSSSSSSSPAVEQLVRANFHSGELLMLRRPVADDGDGDGATGPAAPAAAILRRVRCDTLYSDRSRAWSAHESVSPLIQSLLDGRNACALTVAGASRLVVQPTSDHARGRSAVVAATDAAAADADAAVPATEAVLAELFGRLAGALTSRSSIRRARLSLSLLAVFNETVYDLLGLDSEPPGPSADNPQAQANHMVVVEVQTLAEALLVLKGARETLACAGERGALAPPLTHTVITVCLTLEDRSASREAGATVRSKLQLVELALPLDDEDEGDRGGAPSSGAVNDRERVKQQVAAASSIHALCLALASVRLASERARYSPSRGGGGGADSSVAAAAFVRFHASKLTVLLQDTLRAGGKLLVLVAVPARALAGSPAARRAAATLRLLEQLRLAVGDGLVADRGVGGGRADRAAPVELMGVRDRSLETFMSRLALHQARNSGDTGDEGSVSANSSAAAASTTSLTFSSQDMRESVRRRSTLASSEANGRTGGWETELDAMARRYGGKAALQELLVASQQLQQQQQQQQQLSFAPLPTPLPSPARSPSRSPASTSAPSAAAALLLGVDTTNGHAGTSQSLVDSIKSEGEIKPRRASLSTPRSLQLRGSRNYKAGTSSSMRKSRPRLSIGISASASASASASTSTAALKRSKSAAVRAADTAASSASVSASLRSQSATVGGRVRRETASSALKKARLAAAKPKQQQPARQKQSKPFR